jgi:hypothetical protein
VESKDIKQIASFILAAITAISGYGIFAFSPPPRPAQAVQPSVPSLIPPTLSCLCGTTKASTRPLSVVCPYCRNTLSVQPSASGQVGQVVGEAAVAKVAK